MLRGSGGGRSFMLGASDAHHNLQFVEIASSCHKRRQPDHVPILRASTCQFLCLIM
jgi:hypothetical protein